MRIAGTARTVYNSHVQPGRCAPACARAPHVAGRDGGGGDRRGGRRRAYGTVFAQCAFTVTAILLDAKTSARNFATHQFDLLHNAIFAFRSAAVLRVCVADCVCVSACGFVVFFFFFFPPDRKIANFFFPRPPRSNLFVTISSWTTVAGSRKNNAEVINRRRRRRCTHIPNTYTHIPIDTRRRPSSPQHFSPVRLSRPRSLVYGF